MLKVNLLLLIVLFSQAVIAQSPVTIPLMRKIFHENIDRSQKWIDKLDKKEDKGFNITNDSDINLQITYALYNKVDEYQETIELNSSLDANSKIKYLRGLNEALSLYENAFRAKEVKAYHLPDLINAFIDAAKLEEQKTSILSVIQANEYPVGNILIKCYPFAKNSGLSESREALLVKEMHANPNNIMPILRANPNASFTDSLLKLVARTQQENIYTYAQSTNTALGRKIQSLEDPLVKTIAKLATLNQGRMYFPFLDNLYMQKVTMEEIDKNMADPYKYYRLLVNTQIDYTGRLRQRDTPMAMNALTGMLRQKAVEEFINVINGLHEEPDNVRMRKVEPLNSQELYYLCVMGENEIYTSSYLKVYQRIFERMKHPGSNSLLMSVNFDHFKKFIKMAANYNTLDDFLKRMDKGNAETLMRAFANGLEKTGNLEDAVDVADSYASISDAPLRKLILNEIQSNLNQQAISQNKRGVTIYDLLNTIFMSMDSTNKIDISAKFGIPPIYSVQNKSLRDSAGRIVIQQFFYGDKDGTTVFAVFKNAFNNADWRIVNKADWIEVSSTKGVPITIFANKPLDEKEGLDEIAQQNLDAYLKEKNLQPTIVIHRGHSYHVSSTIGQLEPNLKVVLLGSCGGYQNVNRVLGISPFAHIIASKQVGSGTVNGPMIMSITETLRSGKDLNWPEMWKNLGRKLKDNDLFEDYVPPYKNLGALFIMAYNKIMVE